MLFFIISILLTGLIVGSLARLALPGPDPMSIWMTILLGLAGSLLGNLVFGLLFGHAAGIIAAVLGSMLILYGYRRRNGRGLRA
ncbi:MAG: GlsB/YeaQ/YmgE family stress response membrane protein [Actinomycetota bacterium]